MSLFRWSWNILRKLFGIDRIIRSITFRRSVMPRPSVSEPAEDSLPRKKTSAKHKKQREYKQRKQLLKKEDSAKSQEQEDLQVAERETAHSQGESADLRPSVPLHYICSDCLAKFRKERSAYNQLRKKNQSNDRLGEPSSHSKLVKNGGVESTTAGQSNELIATSTSISDSNSRTEKTTDVASKVDDILELSNELCKKIKLFWGPLDAIKPLEEEIEAMLKNFDNLSSSNDPDIAEGKEQLLYSQRLLEGRRSMIESYNSDDDSSTSSEAAPSRIMSEISTAAMHALRLYKTMRHERPTAKAKVLRGQFIKVQTDLDALKIEADDTEAIETRRGVLLLCNEALATVELCLAENNSA